MKINHNAVHYVIGLAALAIDGIDGLGIIIGKTGRQ